MFRTMAIAGGSLVLFLIAAFWLRGRGKPTEHGLRVDGGTFYAINVDTDAPRFAEYMNALRAGQWTRSEKIALESTRANPTSPGAHFNLGMILYWQRKHKKAIGEWREVLRLDPTHEGATRMLERLGA